MATYPAIQRVTNPHSSRGEVEKRLMRAGDINPNPGPDAGPSGAPDAWPFTIALAFHFEFEGCYPVSSGPASSSPAPRIILAAFRCRICGQGFDTIDITPLLAHRCSCGRGGSILTHGDVEANPGPGNGPDHNTFYWFLSSNFRDLFHIDRFITLRSGPSGESPHRSNLGTFTCVMCGRCFRNISDPGPLSLHVNTCEGLQLDMEEEEPEEHPPPNHPVQLGQPYHGPALQTLQPAAAAPFDGFHLGPGPLPHPDHFQSADLEAADHAAAGRGDDILSDGDVESNPGPSPLSNPAPLDLDMETLDEAVSNVSPQVSLSLIHI